jgi:hypothetical protein
MNQSFPEIKLGLNDFQIIEVGSKSFAEMIMRFVSTKNMRFVSSNDGLQRTAAKS